jgi:hypothetical protein
MMERVHITQAMDGLLASDSEGEVVDLRRGREDKIVVGCGLRALYGQPITHNQNPLSVGTGRGLGRLGKARRKVERERWMIND